MIKQKLTKEERDFYFFAKRHIPSNCKFTLTYSECGSVKSELALYQLKVKNRYMYSLISQGVIIYQTSERVLI